MFGNRRYEPERDPWKMVIYILTVLVLIACLIFLVFYSRKRREMYAERVKQIAEAETDFYMTENADAETESETKPEAESEPESETEPETENKDLSVLILNGTRREGVAGYWKKQLENDGYSDVASASYSESAEEKTVVYAAGREIAEPFLEYFTDAVYRKGTVEEGIETEQGSARNGPCDVYIVIGKNDARNE